MYVLHLVTRNLGNESKKLATVSVIHFPAVQLYNPRTPRPNHAPLWRSLLWTLPWKSWKGPVRLCAVWGHLCSRCQANHHRALGFLSGVLLPCVLNSNWFIDHFFDPLLGFVGSLASLALRTVNHQAPSSTSIWGWSMIQLCTSLWLIRGYHHDSTITFLKP